MLPKKLFRSTAPEVCQNCFLAAASLQVCGKCKVCHYCSADCQRAHWPQHKSICSVLANQHANRDRETPETDTRSSAAIECDYVAWKRKYVSNLITVASLMLPKTADETNVITLGTTYMHQSHKFRIDRYELTPLDAIKAVFPMLPGIADTIRSLRASSALKNGHRLIVMLIVEVTVKLMRLAHFQVPNFEETNMSLEVVIDSINK